MILVTSFTELFHPLVHVGFGGSHVEKGRIADRLFGGSPNPGDNRASDSNPAGEQAE